MIFDRAGLESAEGFRVSIDFPDDEHAAVTRFYKPGRFDISLTVQRSCLRVLLLFANTLADRKKRTSKATRVGILPPLGLGYIAAVLQESGHEVKIVDTRLDGWSPELAKEIQEFDPGVVGISIFVISEIEGYNLATNIKSILPHVPIVMGGPQVGYFPRAPLERCPAVDITVQGEGEYIMRDLVNALQNGRPVDAVPNVYFRNTSGAITASPPSQRVPDLETLPFPARAPGKGFDFRAMLKAAISGARPHGPGPLCAGSL